MPVANAATDDLAVILSDAGRRNSLIAAYMDCIRKKVALQLSASSNLTRLLPVLLQSAGRVFSYLLPKKRRSQGPPFLFWNLKLLDEDLDAAVLRLSHAVAGRNQQLRLAPADDRDR